jgi:hypothetical protein
MAWGASVLLLIGLAILPWANQADAGHFGRLLKRHFHKGHHAPPVHHDPGMGAWYWMRSPEQERRVVISLYNRYCIRCHGVDGRGVWDIPDVPDFTDPRWQGSRPDHYLVRVTLEGRGAVMPPFRGTLTLEESWAMARYLRTFVPGTALPRPDDRPASPPAPPSDPPAPAGDELPPPLPEEDAPGPFDGPGR